MSKIHEIKEGATLLVADVQDICEIGVEPIGLPVLNRTGQHRQTYKLSEPVTLKSASGEHVITTAKGAMGLVGKVKLQVTYFTGDKQEKLASPRVVAN